MADEIKACPLCAAVAPEYVTLERIEGAAYPEFFVKCWKCGCRAGQWDEPLRAIAVWNRRDGVPTDGR